MSIIIDDIYTELIPYLGLTDQLKFRSVDKYHLNRIDSDLLKEYADWKLKYSKKKINFKNTCKYGYIKLAKWLYGSGSVDIHTNDDEAFILSCQNGHLEVAKWLYGLGDVDIHTCRNYAFRGSSDNGHIEVAKWLFLRSVENFHIENQSDNYNIHSYCNWAFGWICAGGHIEVAQFIYQFGSIDIHFDNDYVFKNSPKIITDWLKTI